MNSTRCDIVLPIYNGLTYVKDCVDSILSCTHDHDYKLYIVDDCSDSYTGKYLSELAENNPKITLLRNPENLGFVKSCNLGISSGESPYVVLINSDVIVTPDWLARLVRCMESDKKIASVNPLTNQASVVNVPMPPGANFISMDWLLDKRSFIKYPDVVTGVGFCMMLRRSALEDVGLFDEVYGMGYCEESDLCMKLTAYGYRTVVADNVYVYHKGSGSFTGRDERYIRNRKIFDSRWGNEYRRQFKIFKSKNPLKPVRDMFRSPMAWDPKPAFTEMYLRMRGRLRQGRVFGAMEAMFQELIKVPWAKHTATTPSSVAKVTRPGRLRVTYVLHNLSVAGGVLSVVQLVNELILLGVEARIVTLKEKPEVCRWRFLMKPIVYQSLPDMLKNFPETDVVVATHWTTAPWVAKIMKSGKARATAYFVQDYESWFYRDIDHESREAVINTYKLIPHKIVKSDWLRGMLAKDGHTAKKIRLGMDLARFYQRDVVKLSYPVIMAMARPSTPRRGFNHIIDSFALVKKAMPETEIVLFGDDLSSRHIPFEYRSESVVTDQNRLARLYSTADVFLDGSDFQGFGRTALEAMACGTACVVTDVGGVNEYARHEFNCIMVPPKQPVAFAEAILRIVRDPKLEKKLVANGFETVKDYSHKREARETLSYFMEITG